MIAQSNSSDKYKNIPGVTEWFQAKKSELEKNGGAPTSSSSGHVAAN